VFQGRERGQKTIAREGALNVGGCVAREMLAWQGGERDVRGGSSRKGKHPHGPARERLGKLGGPGKLELQGGDAALLGAISQEKIEK